MKERRCRQLFISLDCDGKERAGDGEGTDYLEELSVFLSGKILKVFLFCGEGANGKKEKANDN